jgi:hypothetical protein
MLPSWFWYAEDFLVSTDNQSHITKIGEATGGSTGEPISFVLPGGGLSILGPINITVGTKNKYNHKSH